MMRTALLVIQRIITAGNVCIMLFCSVIQPFKIIGVDIVVAIYKSYVLAARLLYAVLRAWETPFVLFFTR